MRGRMRLNGPSIDREEKIDAVPIDFDGIFGEISRVKKFYGQVGVSQCPSKCFD